MNMDCVSDSNRVQCRSHEMSVSANDTNSWFYLCKRCRCSVAAGLSAWVVIGWCFFSNADLGDRFSQLESEARAILIQTALLVFLRNFIFQSFKTFTASVCMHSSLPLG